MPKAPPTIFSKQRKTVRRERAVRLVKRSGETPFLLAHLADDLCDRLQFLKLAPEMILVEGCDAGALRKGFGSVSRAKAHIDQLWKIDFDHSLEHKEGTYDLVASINSLDTVNDLPGALIQMRALLRPGGLAMASFIGGQSLPKLRRAMLDAEQSRPAARMHPLINPQSCAELLARAGWKDPVIDSYRLQVRYASLARLVDDLRCHAMGNILALRCPPLTRSAAIRAADAFKAQADADGKVAEIFEIITVTGRR